MTLHPGACISNQREARGVAFRETIASEPFELREGLLGKFTRIAILDHAFDKLVLELAHPACELEGGHGAAQLVGFARRKSRTCHRNLHRALLKKRNAERFAKCGLELGRRILDLFLARTSPQIWMHHVALDGSRPDMATCTTRS